MRSLWMKMKLGKISYEIRVTIYELETSEKPKTVIPENAGIHIASMYPVIY